MNVRHSTTPQSEKRTDVSLSRQWNTIDWKNIRETVNRLQTRIAKAISNGNSNLAKRLQYLLTHSFHAKLLAVRIVTQNRGKRTPGIDGELWTSSKDKMLAVLSLSDKQYQSQPLKRIYIPKPGKETKRPLSIPTMYDRAMQALYALALQPVAETLADSRSFGFRLFRSAQDASQYIYVCLRHKTGAEWILEGDIKACFDNISHQWLKDNILIDTSILNQFLKSGFIYDNTLFPSNTGTPQGGLISPILANMALDGMENLIMEKYPKMKVHFIRYADDFVVTAPTREIAEEIKVLISDFLITRGLTLSDSKTKISHINEGFDFLGWNIRKYKGVLLMKPSKESVKRITRKIGDVLHKAASWRQDEVIKMLNPIIIGWTNYHRHIASKNTFNRIDFIKWSQLWRWAKRRHTDKGYHWIADRYWSRKGSRKWVFCTEEQILKNFADTPIRRHFMVKLEMNPFLDRDYFVNRMVRMKRRIPDVQVKLSYFSSCRPKFGL